MPGMRKLAHVGVHVSRTLVYITRRQPRSVAEILEKKKDYITNLVETFTCHVAGSGPNFTRQTLLACGEWRLLIPDRGYNHTNQGVLHDKP